MERYRVLAAILALGEFDVGELVSLSRVKASTVRTVLRREQPLIQVVERRRTGRPGGRPARYRLRAAARERLQDELGRLKQLDVADRPAASALPLSIAAAEENLITRFPSLETRAQQEILAQSRELFSRELSASAAAGQLDPDVVDLHRRVFEWLERLCVSELELAGHAAGSPAAGPAAARRPMDEDEDLLAGLIQRLRRHSQPATAAALAHRYLTSPARRAALSRLQQRDVAAEIDAPPLDTTARAEPTRHERAVALLVADGRLLLEAPDPTWYSPPPRGGVDNVSVSMIEGLG